MACSHLDDVIEHAGDIRKIAVLAVAALAVANEIVWRTMSTDAWVKIETFGFPLALFLFLWLQIVPAEQWAVILAGKPLNPPPFEFLAHETGLSSLTWGHVVMWAIAVPIVGPLMSAMTGPSCAAAWSRR